MRFIFEASELTETNCGNTKKKKERFVKNHWMRDSYAWHAYNRKTKRLSVLSAQNLAPVQRKREHLLANKTYVLAIGKNTGEDKGTN